MHRHHVQLGVLILLAMPLIAGCSNGLTEPSNDENISRKEYVVKAYRVSEYNESKKTLEIVEVSPGKSHEISTSRWIAVDSNCLFSYKWDYEKEDELLISFLHSGCVAVEEATATNDERRAQQSAISAGRGVWEDFEHVDSTSISHSASDWIRPALEDAIGFFRLYWATIIGAILSIVGAWWFAQWWHDKRVRVVLTGLPAAGKTDFWIALQEGNAPKADSPPTTATLTSSSLSPIVFGKYILTPNAIDTAGTQPQAVLDELLGQSRVGRWRTKLLLVVVISTSPLNRRNGNSVLDVGFLAHQDGATQFWEALIRTKTHHIRPHGVMLFLTKMDLVSDNPPASHRVDELPEEVAAIHHKLEAACLDSKIPFKFIAGSSRIPWGIAEARDFFSKVVYNR